jgi:hypothetical protein
MKTMAQMGLLAMFLGLISGSMPAAPPPAHLDRRAARNSLPPTKLYDSVPVPPGKPGQLIRSEQFDDYDLQADMNATRILYHSRSAQGKDTAVTGVVLVPDKPVPSGGWPLIAWAHGFTGVARQCSPSLKRNLEYGPVLSMWLNLGYAIVASDYAGLGTNPPYSPGDLLSHANDLIASIKAARSVVPQIGSRWVAMGQAEGAGVVIALAEEESELHDVGFLGALAVSTYADFNQAPDHILQASSGESALLLVYDVASSHPGFPMSDILQPQAAALYKSLQDSCSNPAAGLPAEDILKSNWAGNPQVREFLAGNQLGQKPAAAPLLVVSGAPPSGTTASRPPLIARMCKLGDHVEFDQYQKESVSGAYGDSVRSQMAWVRDRFEGRPAQSNCR